ncbi:MAG: hypothetical protein JRD89_01915 [Deltaproteobacteria bacterium]|nr:hypothetical protein [Deltaproteobacteria bacterium]
MLPSQLTEGQWIKIQVNTEYHEAASPGSRLEPTGAIGFHVHYGSLCCHTINHDQNAYTHMLGLLITDDPSIADGIYQQWVGVPTVKITTSQG